MSNALIESTNTKLRLLIRLAYGFRSTDNLIANCLLDRVSEAATAHPSPAGNDPRIEQKSQKIDLPLEPFCRERVARFAVMNRYGSARTVVSGGGPGPNPSLCVSG